MLCCSGGPSAHVPFVSTVGLQSPLRRVVKRICVADLRQRDARELIQPFNGLCILREGIALVSCQRLVRFTGWHLSLWSNLRVKDGSENLSLSSALGPGPWVSLLFCAPADAPAYYDTVRFNGRSVLTDTRHTQPGLRCGNDTPTLHVPPGNRS